MILLNGDDPNCVEVAQNCLAPLVEVGFSPNCAQRIRDVAYSAAGSCFTLGEDHFELPLIGEFNVRNAAMAISAAKFYQVPNEKIQKALKKFEGIARRQEVRGEARGVKVIDDFGHHPTAITQTMDAMRHRYRATEFGPSSSRAEHHPPRSLSAGLPDALSLADGVFISEVARLDQIPEADRLNPGEGGGSDCEIRPACLLRKNAEAIIDRLVPMVQQNDVVAIFSNGGFDRIHEKLLERLRVSQNKCPSGICFCMSTSVKNRDGGSTPGRAEARPSKSGRGAVTYDPAQSASPPVCVEKAT